MNKLLLITMSIIAINSCKGNTQKVVEHNSNEIKEVQNKQTEKLSLCFTDSEFEALKSHFKDLESFAKENKDYFKANKSLVVYSDEDKDWLMNLLRKIECNDTELRVKSCDSITFFINCSEIHMEDMTEYLVESSYWINLVKKNGKIVAISSGGAG